MISSFEVVTDLIWISFVSKSSVAYQTNHYNLKDTPQSNYFVTYLSCIFNEGYKFSFNIRLKTGNNKNIWKHKNNHSLCTKSCNIFLCVFKSWALVKLWKIWPTTTRCWIILAHIKGCINIWSFFVKKGKRQGEDINEIGEMAPLPMNKFI